MAEKNMQCDGVKRRCQHKSCCHYELHADKLEKCLETCKLEHGCVGASCSRVTEEIKDEARRV